MNPLNYIGSLIGENITFANPEMFWLLLIIPFLFLFSILHKTKRSPSLKFSQVTDSMVQHRSLRTRLRYLPNCIRFIALSLIIVALARPQVVSSEKDIKTEGIDIVISMDVSSSMEAEDFKPNRLEAAKTTAKEFIDYRLNDRIGLVIFAAESFTQCPVTIDHDILKSFFKDIKTKITVMICFPAYQPHIQIQKIFRHILCDFITACYISVCRVAVTGSYTVMCSICKH